MTSALLPPHHSRIVAGVFAGATLLSLSRLLQMYLVSRIVGSPVDLRVQVVSQVSFWYGWALVALLALALLARLSGRRTPPLGMAAGLASIALLAVALQPAVYVALHRLLHDPNGAPAAGREVLPALQAYRLAFATNLQVNLLVVGMTGGIAFAFSYYRRFREREHAATMLAAQLSQARLDALRAQLNPHFLFNAMNTIAMLAREGATDEVVRMVTGLSELLRCALDDERPHYLPLRDELLTVDHYLRIEQVRFRNRLRVSVAVAPEAGEARVPSFILQPLVENAIRHGIAKRRLAGRLDIAAHRSNGSLVVQVRDDGPGPLHDASPGGTGVGLRNTRARLSQIYGRDFALDLAEHPEGGAIATLTIPFQRVPVAGEPA